MLVLSSTFKSNQYSRLNTYHKVCRFGRNSHLEFAIAAESDTEITCREFGSNTSTGITDGKHGRPFGVQSMIGHFYLLIERPAG
jgi:hypothetical protein